MPLNRNRKARLVGIGMGLSTKINASIGTSTDIADVDAEVRKAVTAQEAGADTLMELSVGGRSGSDSERSNRRSGVAGWECTPVSGVLRSHSQIRRS